MAERNGAGWTSPQVIVAAIGLGIGAFGSYNLMQRDDTREVQAKFDDHSHRLAIMETRLEYLANELRENRQQRDRPDR